MRDSWVQSLGQEDPLEKEPGRLHGVAKELDMTEPLNNNNNNTKLSRGKEEFQERGMAGACASVLKNYLRAKCGHSGCGQKTLVWGQGWGMAAPETLAWAAGLTSLKWTSCMPTSSIMEASSSMFGVMTLKAVHPCLNMPRIETAGDSWSYQPEGGWAVRVLPTLFCLWAEWKPILNSCVSCQHFHRETWGHRALAFTGFLIFKPHHP